MTNSKQSLSVEELAEYWESQCNRYANGQCSSRRCLVRGGWQTGPVDYSIATCEEHETATILRSRSPLEDNSNG